ncbi:MAG: alpha/beta fold hydrolase [Leptolyngbyaceae cyanobacterium SU_3_3]|nr:alpha/beta fold hydrolase [Leptolyngbyaceae cyanobacterium SU_3_3]NJR49182.1 alpha/beta fold hydrolase [Leptolyngbyaceae cyanobacterium CSU_1_3]
MVNHSTDAIAAPETRIGGSVKQHNWSWKEKSITATYEVLGEGKPILLLPALSSVSSRAEMRGLAERLAQKYQVFALDWVGFGDSSRLAIDCTPALYESFLRNFVQTVFSEPIVVVAAGHSAGYVMEMAAKAYRSSSPPWRWVVLVSPTWRGPLPTAMGEHRRCYRALQLLINTPVLGQTLYFLNTTRGFLRFMYGRHVFADAKNITRDLIEQKWQTTKGQNARFSSAAFVTGALDAVKKREAWFNLFQSLPMPVMMVIGDNMPPKSRAEVEVLAHFSGVQVHRMPGSLGLHEEYPIELAEGILPFLDKYLS